MTFTLFSAAGLLALVLLLAGVSLRSKRHDAGIPATVTSRVLRVRNFLSDVYAARVGSRVIVFDAGMDPDARALERLLASLGADLDAVSDIFLTHGHFDHVAAAARCPHAKVHIGAADAEVLAHRIASRALVPRLFGTLLGTPAVEASHRLEGSASVDVGQGESVLAVPMPGHTPGSYAYLFDGVLFTGDALWIDDAGITLTEAADVALTQATCRSIAQINELFQQHRVSAICTGHRGCTPLQGVTPLLEVLVPAAAESCAD